ncbi:hypothetical protein AALH30_24550 [Blautia pseudococcoides]|uniref:hypothetical protein n=1 Tax=Blautia pseudococcoides TaxID=1796616 RepID=UPI0035158A67
MEIGNKKLEEMLTFLKAACDAVKDCHKAKFTCPICGSTARVIKSRYNGHRHASCSGCDANFIE